MRKSITYLGAILLLSILAVGNSPKPLEYTYEFRCVISNAPALDSTGLNVLIYSIDSFDSLYRPVDGYRYDDYAVGRTNRDGYFYVSATTQRPADFLRLGVFSETIPLRMTEPIGVVDSLGKGVYENYQIVDDSGFLGCYSAPEEKQYLARIVYTWEEIEFTVSEPPPNTALKLTPNRARSVSGEINGGK